MLRTPMKFTRYYINKISGTAREVISFYFISGNVFVCKKKSRETQIFFLISSTERRTRRRRKKSDFSASDVCEFYPRSERKYKISQVTIIICDFCCLPERARGKLSLSPRNTIQLSGLMLLLKLYRKSTRRKQ